MAQNEKKSDPITIHGVDPDFADTLNFVKITTKEMCGISTLVFLGELRIAPTSPLDDIIHLSNFQSGDSVIIILAYDGPVEDMETSQLQIRVFLLFLLFN